MKPIDISTPKGRIKVYKKALDNPDWFLHVGLCYILQYIRLGHDMNLYPRPVINYRLTSEMFPEFGHYYNPSSLNMRKDGPALLTQEQAKFKHMFLNNRYNWRMKILNLCIEMCRKQIVSQKKLQ